jgi:hypothetical protein
MNVGLNKILDENNSISYEAISKSWRMITNEQMLA